MNKLGVSDDKAMEYEQKAKENIQRAVERKEAIERRGELYDGELQIALDDIKTSEEMLKIIHDNS